MLSGPIPYQILSSDLAASIPCGGASGTVYSHSFSLMECEDFGFDFLATSDGVVNFAISIEEGNSLPDTEGSSDANWVIPENYSTLITITDETTHIIAFAPVVAKYGRLKIVKASGNDASTVLAAKLLKTEHV